MVSLETSLHISAQADCVSTVITPDNASREMNRVIAETFKQRKLAYISISLDDGKKPVTDKTPIDPNCYHITII